MSGPGFRVRGLRGVISGVGCELQAGELATLPAGTAAFLCEIGAAELLDPRDAGELAEVARREQQAQQRRGAAVQQPFADPLRLGPIGP